MHPDAHRSAPSVTCPFLRLEGWGPLLEPVGAPNDDNRCVALAGPWVLSRQQQELVCLRATHLECPRYRRAAAGTSSTARTPSRVPGMPGATAAALVVLALSAGISFGFVIQRGGIGLPSADVSPGGVGSVASGGVAAASPASPTPAAAPGASPTPSGLASDAVPPSAPTTTPLPSAIPTAKPKPKPTPAPAASGGVPSADRLAVIKPCPGQAGCWTYNVRAGDNLWSIAHWFGVPLDTVYAWNPTVKQTGTRPGMPLKIPTPTR